MGWAAARVNLNFSSLREFFFTVLLLYGSSYTMVFTYENSLSDKMIAKKIFYRTVLNCIGITANEVYSIAVKDMLEITHIFIILAFCLMFLIIFSCLMYKISSHGIFTCQKIPVLQVFCQKGDIVIYMMFLNFFWFSLSYPVLEF